MGNFSLISGRRRFAGRRERNENVERTKRDSEFETRERSIFALLGNSGAPVHPFKGRWRTLLFRVIGAGERSAAVRSRSPLSSHKTRTDGFDGTRSTRTG